jgi:hypothetical protein
MLHHLKQFIFLICIANSSITYAAEWRANTTTDPMTDERTTFAEVRNANSKFFLYTQENSYWKEDSDLYPRYRYIGCFVLTGNNFSQIHYEPKVISVRVDKNRLVNMFFTSWEPRIVYFDMTKERRLIEEMKKGKELLVEYPISRNQRKIERFSLTGSAIAMKKALIGYKSAEQR